jgi:excisionase family DNA binding protein
MTNVTQNQFPQKLFDFVASVAYLHSLGATAATVSFVRGLVASGQITHLRIGKKFYVSRESLDGWIANRQRRMR